MNKSKEAFHVKSLSWAAKKKYVAKDGAKALETAKGPYDGGPCLETFRPSF